MAGAQLSLSDQIRLQRELMAEGEYDPQSGKGYIVLGRMIELRHELAKDGNAPARSITDRAGLVLDWKHFHNGPVIARDRASRNLFITSRVGPLPDLPDPDFEFTKFVLLDGNKVPLKSIPVDMRKTLKNSDGSRVEGLDGESEAPRMIKQRYVDHARGTFEEFMVIGPVTQVLFKIDGIVGMSLISFSGDAYTGEMPMFLLNPANGEAHFAGGQFTIGG